jgi:tetratricopeptide (TPR) repeat protein
MVWMALWVVMATGPLASAQSVDDAQKKINEASRLYAEGDFNGALRQLQEAETLAAKMAPEALPSIRYNIARCLERLERWEEALEAYERYTQLPDDPQRKQRAYDAVQSLQSKVFATLSVACDPAGTLIEIQGITKGKEPCPLMRNDVAPGAYGLKATHPGYLPTTQLVELQAGTSRTLELALERDPEAAPLMVQAAADEEGFRFRPVPWATVGGGVAAIGAGIAFNVLAANNRSDAEELPPGPDRDALVSDFERDRALAISLYAVGGAAVVTGIVLFFVTGDDESDQALGPVRAGPGGLAVNF